MAACTVHAQQTIADGSRKVYRVPFPTVAAARAYCTGHHHPERAVLVTSTRIVRYDAGREIGREEVVTDEA